MSIILPARLQYVYWLAVFGIFMLLIKIPQFFLQSAEARISIIFTIIYCLARVATHIDKKIFWGHWKIVHITGNKWKCLLCEETFQNLYHFLREKHKIHKVCVENPTDDTSQGCGAFIAHCNQDAHRVATCNCHQTRYRVCKDVGVGCGIPLSEPAIVSSENPSL